MAFGSEAPASPTCLDGSGSAAIVNSDLPSARLEAAARARWAALEQAVGVEVRSQSLVENSQLLDDLVSVKGKGTITSSRVIAESKEADLYNVTVNACVEPAKAAETIASLALNSSVAVFVPARKPKERAAESSGGGAGRRRSGQTRVVAGDEVDETNIFSETLIGKLVEQGFTVTDIAPSKALDAAQLEQALKSGNFLTMRSLVSKFLSNLLVVGKIDYTVSERKGEDIGYDLQMPFNRVTERLTYRLLTREAESGKLLVLAAGTSEATAMAGSVEDAAALALKKLADKTVPTLLERVARHLKGASRKLTVKVDGLAGVEGTLDLRRLLAGVTWVSDVEAVGLDEYRLSYPENSIYLANSLSRQPNLKVVEYSPYRIRLLYRAPSAGGQ
jgi:hypothetical protein